MRRALIICATSRNSLAEKKERCMTLGVYSVHCVRLPRARGSGVRKHFPVLRSRVYSRGKYERMHRGLGANGGRDTSNGDLDRRRPRLVCTRKGK